MQLNFKRTEEGKCVDYYFYGTGNIPKQELSCKSDQIIVVHICGKFDKLEDDCFSNDRLKAVVLNDGFYRHVGDRCFMSPILDVINLPETLESIGHDNFNGKLRSIEIPRLVKHFPVDNLIECNDLFKITVTDGNASYSANDGLLYNKDATAVLFCPNDRSEPVILPNTVIHIGESCFSHCKKLEKIFIPSTVETIGDRAFCGCKIKDITIPHSVRTIGKLAFNSSEIESLKVPDSVTAIGRSCFESARIIKKLKLPNHLTVIPEGAFNGLRAPIVGCSFTDVKHIGSRALSFMEGTPYGISFESLQSINSRALSYFSGRAIELYSCLKSMGYAPFDSPRHNICIRYHSMCPIKLDNNALKSLHKFATLVVPPGAKAIFERAEPWALFNKIEECSIDMDLINGNLEKVSQEKYVKRLKSLLNSTCNYDSTYLEAILNEVSQDYICIKTNEEYQAACSLLRYNRMFTPPIIPGLDLYLIRHWPIKYRTRYVADSMESGVLLLQPSILGQATLLLSEDASSMTLSCNTEEQINGIGDMPNEEQVVDSNSKDTGSQKRGGLLRLLRRLMRRPVRK